MYRDGTSGIDLTEVIYNFKKEAINNVAPGVFFYYTTFTAPKDLGFTIKIEQDNVLAAAEDFPYFVVQNESNIRLFNRDDCTIPTVSFEFSFADGQAWVDFKGPDYPAAGDVFVVSVKFETGAVVGLPEPDVQLTDYPYDPTTVHYSYKTYYVDLQNPEFKVLLDMDIDGVLLKKKGK
jgi:hypothetical protein